MFKQSKQTWRRKKLDFAKTKKVILKASYKQKYSHKSSENR